MSIWRILTGVRVLVGAWVEGGDLRWRWSHPEPHGNNVKSMAVSASGTFWIQVGEQGTVYTSSDGFSWLPRESGVTTALRSVTFFGDRAVITGEAGTVLYADGPVDIRAGTLAGGATEDWLEGVAASESRVVAVGDNGTVYTSEDGVTWTARSSGTTDWLTGVAYGAGKFVAVGEMGRILTSSDGLQWSRQTHSGQELFTAVQSTGEGFVIVGDAGTVLSSANGGQWQSISSGSTNDLFTVGSVGADLFVAGDEAVEVRVNGVWKDETTGVNRPPATEYYSGLGLDSSIYLGGRTGMMTEGFRTELGEYIWSLHSTLDRPWLFDLFCATNIFVSVGDMATIMTSVDGISWAFEFPPTNFVNSIFLGVGGGTNLLVVAGSDGSLLYSPNTLTNVVSTNGSGMVVTQEVSTLGVIWHAVDLSPTGEDLQGVCEWDGRVYVTGSGGTLLSSPDGVDWLVHPSPGSAFLSGVAGYAGGLVAVGTGGALYHSADGTAWTDYSQGVTNWIYRVRDLNGLLVAVGQAGYLATSEDGVVWQRRDTGTDAWLTDATWVGGSYYATGLWGTVLRSVDGVAWEDAGTITLKDLYGAATDGERLIVAGAEGVVLRSPVALPEVPVEILQWSREPAVDGAVWEYLYLFGGEPDQRFTLDYRSELMEGDWGSSRVLEVEPDGTLIYLQRIGMESVPSREFYQTTLTP
ncbi:MAG: WD40/YVTN/BNR-like repeat-containing protein [Limisphaerales bacterium]